MLSWENDSMHLGFIITIVIYASPNYERKLDICQIYLYGIYTCAKAFKYNYYILINLVW